MAQGRRVAKFAALIRQEMSLLLLNGIRDPSINSSMISITDVEVSGDLQHCKIFVSLLDQTLGAEKVLFALNDASGYLKGELGRTLQMRRTPEIIFKLDKGMEKSSSLLKLLVQLEDERQLKGTKFIDQLEGEED